MVVLKHYGIKLIEIQYARLTRLADIDKVEVFITVITDGHGVEANYFCTYI